MSTAAQAAEWRRRNPGRAAAAQAELRKRHVLLVRGVKNVPCSSCGQRFPPACMDLHHVDGAKDAPVSRMIGKVSEARLLSEIAKCVVLCACCHRLVHASGVDKHG